MRSFFALGVEFAARFLLAPLRLLAGEEFLLVGFVLGTLPKEESGDESGDRGADDE